MVKFQTIDFILKCGQKAFALMQSEIQQIVKFQNIDFIRKAGRKKNKAFAHRVPIGNYNYLQCSFWTEKSNSKLALCKKTIQCFKRIVFIFTMQDKSPKVSCSVEQLSTHFITMFLTSGIIFCSKDIITYSLGVNRNFNTYKNSAKKQKSVHILCMYQMWSLLTEVSC